MTMFCHAELLRLLMVQVLQYTDSAQYQQLLSVKHWYFQIKLHIQGFSLQYKHACVELKIVDFSEWCRIWTRPNQGLSLSCSVEMGRKEPWERGCRFPLTLQVLRVISIKILLVISMPYKTDWWWESRRWSHKLQWVDTLTTSCYRFYRKHIGTANGNLNFDIRA